MPYDVFSLDLGIVRGLQSVFFTQRSKTNEGSLFRECISERIPFILVVIGLARPVRSSRSRKIFQQHSAELAETRSPQVFRSSPVCCFRSLACRRGFGYFSS